MYNHEELPTADTFARLATELHDSEGVEETVDTVVQFAVRALACCQAGIVLAVRGRRPEIGAVTDPLIERIHAVQIAADDGPMIAALQREELIRIADVRTDGRWPHWAALVCASGIRTVLHLPLMVGNRASGVLSLYCETPDALTGDDEAVAHILARHASVAVASAQHEASLAQAVDARKLIGQAMGILMERYGLSDDRAFEVLKRYSQDSNTKLRDVAQQLIDTRKLPVNGQLR
ncbi:GAF and ANTAR domain-containing protein [Kribbella sancticallisti]|uniref:GAF and ANTAR domain-containing protein n=1 Tax=Kribbella sancticallisti TaxID=460087 RepID=A0ABN2D2M0_9ACTN